MQEQPIYDAVVREHKFEPRDVIRFNFDHFLAKHKAAAGIPKKARPRKAARRGRRS